MRKADLHQGSFVLREVVAGFAGEAVALVALTGTTALGYGLFSRCSVHGIVVDVLRIGCPTTTPDWPLAIAGTSELVLVPLGAALGARLAVGHPFSGSLWRALGYALLVELATFVTGAFLSVALNAKDSDIPIDLVLATSAAAFPPLASSGLHLSPQSKRPVPRGTGRACFALRSD